MQFGFGNKLPTPHGILFYIAVAIAAQSLGAMKFGFLGETHFFWAGIFIVAGALFYFRSINKQKLAALGFVVLAGYVADLCL